MVEHERAESAMERTEDRDVEPTTAIIKKAIDDATELVRLEVRLAKAEARTEIKQVEGAAISFAIATALAIVVIALLAVGVVLALGATPLHAFVAAAVFLVLAVISVLAGRAMLPDKPLERTRKRFTSDVHQLKEHIL